ncbi:MAG TPA: DEAD/DEAH box helicase, partial [Anaerolineales bacterium]|nr:DEAD/DEAH box helicase [Anaerolineales bacterium]
MITLPMSSPASILKETFGYDTFRPLQCEVIENVLAGRDTLAVMPTGGGKSLCYQIPALLFEGLTVVVSPLISLMKDKVEQLRAFGVPSLFLNSSLSPQSYQENMEYIRRGEVKLLYVAPETLLTQRVLSL